MQTTEIWSWWNCPRVLRLEKSVCACVCTCVLGSSQAVDRGSSLFSPAYYGFPNSLLALLMVTVPVSLTLFQAGPPNSIPHPGFRNKLGQLNSVSWNFYIWAKVQEDGRLSKWINSCMVMPLGKGLQILWLGFPALLWFLSFLGLIVHFFLQFCKWSQAPFSFLFTLVVLLATKEH